MIRQDVIRHFNDVDIDIVVTRLMTHVFGLTANTNGFYYIRRSVRLALDDPSITTHITKTLYPVLGRMFLGNVEKGAIHAERTIRQTIEKGWKRRNMKLSIEIFGDMVTRPTNTQFIDGLTEYTYQILLNLKGGTKDD